MVKPITIIGGGLAGCEAAWQIARRGFPVRLWEMKPLRFSPAHKSPLLAEIICSNSLGSNAPNSASGLLKAELRQLRSLIVAAADASAVPAGGALAVERGAFSQAVEAQLSQFSHLEILRQEVEDIPRESLLIIAAGPLCTETLAQNISSLTGAEHLFFYDAIAPLVEGESLDKSTMFWANRRSDDKDYLNIPLTKDQYEGFYRELLAAKVVDPHPFEEQHYFESCLPIEVLAARGRDTLRFGPMKPVGLVEPTSGQQPYAVVQLRKEDKEGRLFNIVGFQTKLTWSEQKRIFTLLPGMENVTFARLGSLHRNTFINSPLLLEPNLSLREYPQILFAGQLLGVEGYMESTAMGLLAGINALAIARGKSILPPPPTTAMGALIKHVTTKTKNFQPMNINFGILPPLPHKVPKKERGERYSARALAALSEWMPVD
ncbi:MAG: methylenetetrahydrofolate--tRNA-(uracil(54)-C(5))-methyltransferase (FADH(2)-oxidizing) TrmFO [Deltaproteobacteria bacterium]|nr:methylenetetrahydrofolate--tRNA-(uracil(54)-C(5))-methyltransferase (FADH(2)-oxidizing) TrmFO [Deltaproteobacteria bacterium]